MSSADTIFALATPPGKSGVAVIRLSGARAAQALFALTGWQAQPRMAKYVTFCDMDGQVVDKGLALYFPNPKSFTGEDVVECHIHGGLAVIREFLGVLSGMGLRPAEVGEFTRRAFANGKMDLLEAEGLADLIDAETSAQKTQAQRQMEGALSAYYAAIRTQMLTVLAHLEAYIDFPDEEIPESVFTGIAGDIAAVEQSIRAAMDDAGRGERLRDGISVVILGAPNVGKSSLLNVLARRDVAIVSQRAGTTRDMIEVHLDMGGYPVVLVDTA
ncbi:MAG: tRNA uridine-5-carboxymethylaminomethyl(34) synthesis GTPase MnmE, partial [Rickettsiales bacterium]|nr:tRNA uridine-5-carboxymethylaminomethyl(34) synthesis GTPase MnmE [Rickettsiales bacterium]